MNDDIRYLDMIATLHVLVGLVAGLFSCLPLINLSMGVSMLSDIPKMIVQDITFSPFALLPIIFTLLPILIVIVGWMLAIAISLNGYYIKNRQWHTYCLVIGGIETIFMPFGTVLGVFTIILLTKPDIKKLFDLDEES